MKRRGFLGFAAGAVVAGPGMAKEAAAKAAQSLALSGGAVSQGGNLLGLVGGVSSSGYANAVSQMPGYLSPIANATQQLAKIAAITPEQRARRKQQMGIGAIDPDIASYKSISLSTKIDWQKERQLNMTINNRRNMWQRVVDGLMPEGDYDLF